VSDNRRNGDAALDVGDLGDLGGYRLRLRRARQGSEADAQADDSEQWTREPMCNKHQCSREMIAPA